MPIIKFEHAETGIEFDISVNKTDGVKQVSEVKKMMSHYPEFKYLVFVFKTMLKLRKLSETYTGGVGSFLLFCMLHVYLRKTHSEKKYLMLSEHVMQFMKYYSNLSAFSDTVIYVATGSAHTKPREHNTFSLMSPQDSTHDIGKGAFHIKKVFNVFQNRLERLWIRQFEPGESILKELISPPDGSFRYIK